jgi:hypothetical protein
MHAGTIGILLLVAGGMALARDLPVAGLRAEKTQAIDFASGGTVRLRNSTGALTIVKFIALAVDGERDLFERRSRPRSSVDALERSFARGASVSSGKGRKIDLKVGYGDIYILKMFASPAGRNRTGG